MKLLLENWRQFLTEQNIAYSGIILDEESKQKLLEMPIPEGWEPLAHHMTITMGPLQHPKGKHDFSTFRASSCGAKSPIKTLDAVFIKKSKEKIVLTFISKSFLQQQVRSMVGCLKYLGEEKWKFKDFKNALRSKKRSKCASPAPAHGLYLYKVSY